MILHTLSNVPPDPSLLLAKLSALDQAQTPPSSCHVLIYNTAFQLEHWQAFFQTWPQWNIQSHLYLLQTAPLEHFSKMLTKFKTIELIDDSAWVDLCLTHQPIIHWNMANK